MKKQQIDLIALGRKYPLAAVIVVVLLLIGCVVYLFITWRLRANAPKPPEAAGAAVALEKAAKPQPVNAPFKGCPPEGDGGDPVLNRLKNRVDEASYIPVAFDTIVQLPWPEAIERRNRKNWAASDAAEVARFEGAPVAVEGFLVGSKQEGPESPNCHGADAEFRDFHIWVAKTAGEDRSHSIVVEVTPPLRDKHPNWRTDMLGQINRRDQRVRVSGWLMLDPEHPDQVGKTRGTIWEIHPVTKIEVLDGSSWTDIDNLR
jgi:hypothetical protein